MPAATVTSRAQVRVLRSKRLLALAGDQRLVEQIRRGNELAFEVAFERHGTGILGFCRHMLGSREEAEDAVQHTFAAAFRDLQRGGERDIALKAWLYTIARNRCLSVLRARREQAAELQDLPTAGLSEQVEQRAELRELLADVRDLPEEQRAALLLAEAAGLSHAEVAEVLGCETGSVKGLVFRARSALIEMRSARETSCVEIREQLATLRGGALRRNELRHHLRRCPGCTAYREEVRRQRQMLAAALPVVPSLGLKSSVLGAAGVTGGAAAGGAAAGGAVVGGFALGPAAAAKVAVVAMLAGGTVVAREVVVHQEAQRGAAEVAPAADGVGRGDDEALPAAAPGPAHAPGETRGAHGETRGARGERISSERNRGQRGAERRAARSNGHGHAGSKPKAGKGEQTNSAGGRKLGHQKQAERGGAGSRGVARGHDPSFKAAPKQGQPPKSAQPPKATQPKPPEARVTPPAGGRTKFEAAPAPLPEAAPAPKVAPPGQSKK
jgi:RNA polymerase sigma factor (sigma-70 family)